MTVYRTVSSIDGGWFKLSHTTETTSITEACIEYFADLTDTAADITASPSFARRGAKLGGIDVGSLPAWQPGTNYTAGTIVTNGGTPVKRKTTGVSSITFTPADWDGVLAGDYGLYIQSWELTKLSDDAFNSWWEQKITLGPSQPIPKEEDKLPLDRGVRRLPRIREFTDMPSTVDAIGQSLANTAGDIQTGFTIPVPIYRHPFRLNTNTYQEWMAYDGHVSTVGLRLPVVHRNPEDKTQTPLFYVDAPAGTALLLIEKLPMEAIEEAGQRLVTVDYELRINPRGWSVPILNQGFQEIAYVDANRNRVEPSTINEWVPNTAYAINAQVFRHGKMWTATAAIPASQYFNAGDGWSGTATAKVPVELSNGEIVKQPVFLDAWGRAAPEATPFNNPTGPVRVDIKRSQTTGPNRTQLDKIDAFPDASTGFQFGTEHIGRTVVFRDQTTGLSYQTFVIELVSGGATVFISNGSSNGKPRWTGSPCIWGPNAIGVTSFTTDMILPGIVSMERQRYPLADLSSVPV